MRPGGQSALALLPDIRYDTAGSVFDELSLILECNLHKNISFYLDFYLRFLCLSGVDDIKTFSCSYLK